MALSTAASSVGRPLLMAMTQALGAVTGRAASTGASSVSGKSPSKSTTQPPKRPSSIVEPTYTYMPPGSSMREPLYNFSASDPVNFIDPRPDPKAAARAAAQAPAGEEKAAVSKKNGTQQQQTPPKNGRKIDISHITTKQGDDGRPGAAGLRDDMAQQGYVVNPTTHSMREPKYVSVSDPKYTAADKK